MKFFYLQKLKLILLNLYNHYQLKFRKFYRLIFCLFNILNFNDPLIPEGAFGAASCFANPSASIALPSIPEGAALLEHRRLLRKSKIRGCLLRCRRYPFAWLRSKPHWGSEEDGFL